MDQSLCTSAELLISFVLVQALAQQSLGTNAFLNSWRVGPIICFPKDAFQIRVVAEDKR